MSDISAVGPVMAPPAPVAGIQAALDRLASGQLPSFSQYLVQAAQAQVSSGQVSSMTASLGTGVSGLPVLGPAPAPVYPSGNLPSSWALGGIQGPGVSAPTQASFGSSIVADAQRYLGVPYVWGGTSPTTGFDCSGLVQHVFADMGVSLPRTSEAQATVGQAVPSLAQAQPGDLVFYGSPAYHVGIYIGGGKMINAPHTGTDVQVSAVGNPTSIRRVAPPSQPAAAGANGSVPGVPQSLAPLFAQATAQYGLPQGLLAAIGQVESNYNPSAVSSAGAQGLMQIMPSTAAGLGINPFDPAQAVDGAARILAGNMAQFRSLPLAVAAYNAGAGAVSRYGGIPPYTQTQTYVSRVMSLMGSTL
ncbi:MAG: NlpC/P60 family protein [Actinomycetota bacterium]|nr:NlpC/P60 family protein [Actinomycetota bacterium]